MHIAYKLKYLVQEIIFAFHFYNCVSSREEGLYNASQCLSNSGKHMLHLITHPEPEDRVEVFEIRSRRGRPYALAHLRTITDPSFR